MLGQIVPLVDDSWRVKFEQVRNDGFSQLKGWWVFANIIAPVLIHLLTALCVPYVFARGLFPLLGYSLMTNSAVYRYAWLGCLFFGIFWYGGHRLHQWLMDLHDSIRDDRYLVGRRLHNYGDHKKAPPSPELLRLPASGTQFHLWYCCNLVSTCGFMLRECIECVSLLTYTCYLDWLHITEE
jgi:hypothetical protein